MRRVIAWLALAASVALVAGGCGGGGSSPLNKADYEKQMGAIGTELTTALNSLGTATTAAGAATSLKKLQTELTDAADKMEAITPPEKVETEHQQLADGVRDFGDQLDPIITELEDGKMEALSGVTSLSSLLAIQKASMAINKKGYDITGTG